MCQDPNAIQVGTSFIYYADDISRPHHKRCIIVGRTDDGSQLAAVFINTNINPHDLDSPELAALHYEIGPPPHRNYIVRQSFVDCSELIHLYPDSLCRNIRENGQIYGQALPDDMENINRLLIEGEAISPYYLKLYGIK